MKGHVDNSTIGLESKELDLSSYFKERNTSNKINIRYMFKGIPVRTNVPPVDTFKISSINFSYNVTRKELEKVVNDVINKTNG